MEVVALLLEKGAKINYRSTRGDTALQQALIHQNLKLVNLLLKNGANVNDPSIEEGLGSAKRQNKTLIIERIEKERVSKKSTE